MEKTISFVGQKFGKLLVTKGILPNTSPNGPNIFKTYECLCECKKPFTIKTSQLIRGTVSCGCQKILSNLTDKLKPGMEFGKLTVVGFSTTKMQWEYKCECGNAYFNGAKSILSGNTKSCGCSHKESGKRNAIALINKNTDPDPKLTLAKRIHRDVYGDGDLQLEDFQRLSQLPCFYCHAETTNARLKKPSVHSYLAKLPAEDLTFRYNGLDRISSDRRHDLDNCVPSCIMCNHSKSNMAKEEFMAWLERLANHDITLSFEDYKSLSIDIDTSFFLDKSKFAFVKSIKYVHKANYKNSDFGPERFYQLSQQDCYYCGSGRINKLNRYKHIKKSSQYAKDTGDFIYNGLDRINSDLTHAYDNIIPCCYTCNFAKDEMPIEDFFAWIERIKKVHRTTKK